MTRVQADPALKDALTPNGDRVEVGDETGRVIGYALTPDELGRLEPTRTDIYAREGDPYDRDEVRAALANPKRFTTEEFLKQLGLE